MRCAAGLTRGHEQGVVAEALVELPQVVERDPRARQCRQASLHLDGPLVAQQAKPQPFAGNVAQLLLDGFDRRRQIGGRGQLDREQAGEPAHGAGQVDGVKQVFTAVTFQLNQRMGVAGPVAQGARQRSEQQVIDLGAVRRRGLLQQLARTLAVQPQADHLAVTHGLAGVRASVGQRSAGVLQVLLPPVAFSYHGVAVGVGTELVRPVLQGAGFFRQRLVGIRCLQVFKHNPPRHTVHHQVMNHQQHALPAVCVVDQHRTQQRALLQRQAALGFIAQPLQCLIALHVRGPQHVGGRRAVERYIPRRPLPLDLTKLQAQRIVAGQHPLQGSLQPQQVQRLARLQQHGLVPVLWLHGLVVEEPTLHRGQGLCAEHRPLGDLRHCLLTGHGRQRLQGRLLKQVARL